MEGKRFIIPIFLAHFGCPHRCIYCDQGRIAHPAAAIPTPEEIAEEVERYLKLGARKRKYCETVQAAFYGGSFTALPLETQRRFLCSFAPFLEEGKVHSLRLSTRPDYISTECLEILKAHRVATIELGVHSMDDEVLRISQRGYTKEVVNKAVRELHQGNFEVGIQLMIGLPGDSAQTFASTVEAVIDMKPHFVRLYPTVVIKGTRLERWFRQGRYQPLSLAEAITLAKGALQRFRQASIPVIRVGLQPNPSLEAPGTIVAGPYHPAFRQLVDSALLFEQAASLVEGSEIERQGFLTFLISPKDISNFYGQGGQNIRRLRETFGLQEIMVKTDPQQERGTVSLSS
ncbi:MAG: radical SAM protein [Desulfobacterales bacterium]|nr:radical SAM protein [Desulfobacterales bacterium]